MHAVGVLDAGEVCVPLQLLGTYKTGKAKFWPWLEPVRLQNHLSCYLFARQRTYLPKCIYEQVLERQVSHKTVKLAIKLVMVNNKLTVFGGS
jgi:hypothetical protein